MNEYTVMLIEADKAMQRLMQHNLSMEHFRVIKAENGLGGLSLFYLKNPDIVLMDLELPDIDGQEVLKQIRHKSETPVIIVSARKSEQDIVAALDSGAHDYVTKPFHMEELKARIRAALRRVQSVAEKQAAAFTMDYLTINFERRKVYVHCQPVYLTPLEYKLLVLLVTNRGKVLTNSYIHIHLWGRDDDGDYRCLRVFMSKVRKKIGDGAERPRFIRTEIGVGYRFLDE